MSLESYSLGFYVGFTINGIILLVLLYNSFQLIWNMSRDEKEVWNRNTLGFAFSPKVRAVQKRRVFRVIISFILSIIAFQLLATLFPTPPTP